MGRIFAEELAKALGQVVVGGAKGGAGGLLGTVEGRDAPRSTVRPVPRSRRPRITGLKPLSYLHVSGESKFQMDRPMRIVTSMACCILFVLTKTAAAQARQYVWSDIDCRLSPIAAWPGLKCRATNVVTSEGNIGVFRQWAAFGTSRDGYYAHLFLWEAQNSFSYLSADETTADFVKWIFESGRSITQVSPVARYKDADYVTFKDGKAGRTCMGFRRVGRPQRGGYDSLTGGILCAPPGKTITEADVFVFIDKARLQPAIR